MQALAESKTIIEDLIIKPLIWEEEGSNGYNAQNLIAYYHVDMQGDTFGWGNDLGAFGLDEPDYEECASIEEGKQQAQAHWEKFAKDLLEVLIN